MGEPEYPEKTADLSQATENLYHIIFYRVHFAVNGVRTTSVVIGTDCAGSGKSNNHTITTTMAFFEKGLTYNNFKMYLLFDWATNPNVEAA